jgi:hypothetical protein
LPGAIDLLAGISGGHFRSHIWPRIKDLAPRLIWGDIVDHLRLRIPPATGGPRYGLLQKCRDLIQHGAPVRLRVERQMGYKSMKYVRHIVVADRFDDGGMKGNIQNGWAWYTGI